MRLILTICLLLTSPAIGDEKSDRVADQIWTGFLATIDVPDDEPQPGDTCPNCGGSGQVGDGTVFSECVPCEGTGKVQAAALVVKSMQLNNENVSLILKSLKRNRESIDDLHSRHFRLVDRLEAQVFTPEVIESPLEELEVAQQPEPRPAKRSLIVAHTTTGCPPCRVAKSREWREKMESVTGFRVEYIPHADRTAYPMWPWFEVYDENGQRTEVRGLLKINDFYRIIAK